MLPYLEYYIIRNQTLGEGLFVSVGPWTISNLESENSRVVQEDEEDDFLGLFCFFRKDVEISDVAAWYCWYMV